MAASTHCPSTEDVTPARERLKHWESYAHHTCLPLSSLTHSLSLFSFSLSQNILQDNKNICFIICESDRHNILYTKYTTSNHSLRIEYIHTHTHTGKLRTKATRHREDYEEVGHPFTDYAKMIAAPMISERLDTQSWSSAPSPSDRLSTPCWLEKESND